jgi:hypothetical protein
MYPDVKAFLNRIASPDPAIRQAAVKDASQQNPEALSGLADLMNNADKAIAKAAKAAMERLVHGTLTPEQGKGKPNSGVREQATEQLLQIAASSRPRLTRAHALHLLGFTGNGSRTEEQILRPLENDPQISEDIRMARQRIRSARY